MTASSLTFSGKKLRMYDLRFPKAETKTGWKQYRRGTWTKPYLVFDNYTSEVRHSMDINKELGLLASGSYSCRIPITSFLDTDK